ncbi:MAG: hypothetical protein Q4C30_03790 [Bacteroidia bacterium]|nr:hypothetical protein [Bacteroidia bacterium]
MGKVTIYKKYITLARKMARENSTARVDGRSVFIKRYPGGNYRIIMVHVTEKQRAMRDMFAEANVMAKADMTSWNRVRHWARYAKRYNKRGAYRAAVSYYCRLLAKADDRGEVESVEYKPLFVVERRGEDGVEKRHDEGYYIPMYGYGGSCVGGSWILAG